MKRKRTKAQIEADARRTGRPPKAPGEKHSRQVNVRMTPGEWKRLSVEAERLGVSLSALLMRPYRKKGD
jgi:predicted HicB family RNase H-like nuclease